MSTHRHRYRVTFEAGLPRDVLASSEESARTTAIAAQRLVGARGNELRVNSVTHICHMGTGQEYCPICRAMENQKGAT